MHQQAGSRVLRIIVLLALAVGLLGCLATVKGTATRFHVLDTTPRTFAVLPLPEQLNSLEFQTYARQVASALEARGWRQAEPAQAECAVFVQYQISQGRAVVFSSPVFGAVPTGNYTTTGTITTYPGGAMYQGTTTQQTRFGVVGSYTGTRTEFDRALSVTIFATPAWRGPRAGPTVFEGVSRSTGTTGDLPRVMPQLVNGLLHDFPGPSGASTRYNLPF
jgi:hypothetical protein